MYKPCCVNPVLLFNKYCLTLVQNGAVACFDGNFTCIFPPIHKLLESVRGLSLEVLDNYYVEFNGIREQMFLYVPCMKCELCRHSKQVDLINRSILETLTWDCPPMFVTLTYREKDIPCLKVGNKRYSVGELRYKDFQDFMKRLRIRWSRKGLKHDVRYLVAGEYGSNPLYSHRCHFHMILWNNPYGADELHPVLFNMLKEDLFVCWSHSDLPAFDFGQCRGGAAPYATKYVCKPPLTYGRCNKPFIRCSSGSRGGLGSIFLQKHIDYLRLNPSINYLDYVDKTGKYNYMFFSKSLSSKVWPSPSRCVSPRLRENYRQLLVCLSKMIYLRIFTYERAFSIAMDLRPSKHIRVFVEIPKFLSPNCVLYSYFFYKELVNVYDYLVDELSVCVDDVDEDYISSYYSHRAALHIQPCTGFAQKLSKIREKIAVQQSKEIL